MADGIGSYRRYLKGDVSALDDLLRIYGDALIRFAYSFLRDEPAAEDVMEECFIGLLAKKRHFPEERSLKAFLFKTARNRCVDVLRKRRRISPLDEHVESASPFDVEEEAFLSDRKRRLLAAMEGLSPGYREILELVYLEGFSAAEASAILHKSRKQIYNLLERAKTTLRGILNEEDFSE